MLKYDWSRCNKNSFLVNFNITNWNIIMEIEKNDIRDCQQIPFITLNGFCQLSNPPPAILNRQYQVGWNTKIKAKLNENEKYACPV